MPQLLEIALSNLLVAALLALPATVAGLWGKRPALTHALWLLVLLKLITPPFFVVPIDWPAPLTVEAEPLELVAKVEPVIESPPVVVVPEVEPSIPHVEDEAIPRADVAEIDPPVIPDSLPEAEPVHPAPSWPWPAMIATVWLTGSVCWLALALVRLARFERMLRYAEPGSAHLHALAENLAADMGIRCPAVRVVPAKISPMLWALGGTPRLVLPGALLARLPAEQLATMLVHELAHWRRRDDRTRWLEMIVLTLYWWCPLVWWARRELRQAEEECCDAWVVSQLPESAKAYALALVETVDFLSDVPAALPMAASGVGHVRLLKRRLTMILQGKTPRALTLTGMLGIAGVGLMLLPLVPGWAQAPRGGGETPQPREKKGERERGPGGQQGEDLQKLRAEIQRLQADLEQRRAEIERRTEQMRQMMEQIRRLEQGNPGRNPIGPMGGGGAGGAGGGGRGAPGGAPGGAGGGRGGPGGMPPGAGPMPGGGPRPPMEQRLNELERKLDQVLQEIRGLRGEMKGRPGGGAPNPMRNLNPMPNPNPRPNANNAPVPPTPPVPPRPPVEPLQRR
jgi:beta-lactamase regulating signal transducer with metallopeptidase domain